MLLGAWILPIQRAALRVDHVPEGYFKSEPTTASCRPESLPGAPQHVPSRCSPRASFVPRRRRRAVLALPDRPCWWPWLAATPETSSGLRIAGTFQVGSVSRIRSWRSTSRTTIADAVSSDERWTDGEAAEELRRPDAGRASQNPFATRGPRSRGQTSRPGVKGCSGLLTGVSRRTPMVVAGRKLSECRRLRPRRV